MIAPEIIPYAVRQDTVEAVERQAAGAPVLGFHRLTARPFALIQTRMEGMKPSLLTSTEKVTKQRLNQLGCALVDSRVVAHDSAAVVEAIDAASTLGAVAVLIGGASAISDRRDIVPAAVEQAGGKLTGSAYPPIRQPADDGEPRRHAGDRDAGLRALAAAERVRLGVAAGSCRPAS